MAQFLPNESSKTHTFWEIYLRIIVILNDPWVTESEMNGYESACTYYREGETILVIWGITNAFFPHPPPQPTGNGSLNSSNHFCFQDFHVQGKGAKWRMPRHNTRHKHCLWIDLWQQDRYTGRQAGRQADRQTDRQSKSSMTETVYSPPPPWAY